MTATTAFVAAALVAALAGCPPPTHYMTAEVTMARMPVEGALVAGECGMSHSAKVTDADGRARLRFHGEVDAAKCLVTVGVPERPPVESRSASLCTTADACPILLFELSGADRSYAMPPRAEVAR